MQGKPLNDREVNAEMKKMMAFIYQEAMEKSREIQIKADEDAHIEKAKYVRKDEKYLNQYFAKKHRQEQTKKKIMQSMLINKMRIEMHQIKNDKITEIVSQTYSLLGDLVKMPEYEILVGELILQALYKMDQPYITIQCCESQRDIVLRAMDTVKELSTSSTHPKTTIDLDEKNYLSNDCIGGIRVYDRHGRIMCDNTLTKRLSMVIDTTLPVIRKIITKSL